MKAPHQAASIHALAETFAQFVPNAGDFEVHAQLWYGWWSRFLNGFRNADPVIQIESAGLNEVRVHLGGESSPVRSEEPAITLAAFVDALRAIPAEQATKPLVAALTVEAKSDGRNVRLVVTIPTRSVDVRFLRSQRAMVLSFGAVLPRKGKAQ